MKTLKNATPIGTCHEVDMTLSSGMREYNEFKADGWKVIWTGEHKVCFQKVEIKAL